MIRSIYTAYQFHFFQKVFLIGCCLLWAVHGLYAQCPEIGLNDLQGVAKAGTTERDAKIQALGFDLRQVYKDKGSVIRVYAKCWNGAAETGKPLFEQKMHWNVTADQVVFFTYKEATFQALRSAVDQKHPTVAASPVVVGRMFKYTFGAERQENVDYYSVSVALAGAPQK